MRSLIELRKDLNATQQDMAVFLNISRSQLSLAELLLRNLPPSAADKVREIQIELSQMSKKKSEVWTIDDKEKLKLEKFLKKKYKECNFQVEKISRALKKVETDEQDANNSFAKLSHLVQIDQERGKRPPALWRRNLSRVSEKLASFPYVKIKLREELSSNIARAIEIEKLMAELL
jgi:transcriptional regulator with XRE-family HTH domain